MRTGLFTRRARAAPFKAAYGCVVLAALTAAVVAGCGDGGGGVHASFVQHAGTRQDFRVYQGVASTAVSFSDALGHTQIRHYATPVAIEVSPPLRAPVAAQVELNPFHFSLGHASPGIAEEGLYTIHSADIIFQGSELLVQYWRFVEDGKSFSGELIQPHVQSQSPLSPTGNLIFLPPDPGSGFPVPYPFGLARGTRLTGTMTSDHISFRVEGNATDHAHPFISEVIATRVRWPFDQ